MEELQFIEIPKIRLTVFGAKIVTKSIFEIYDKSNKYPIINYCLSRNYNIRHNARCIDELKDLLRDFIQEEIKLLNAPTPFNRCRRNKYIEFDSITDYNSVLSRLNYTVSDEEKEIIINQIIMDILFDKYLEDQQEETMNRSNYSDYMAKIYTHVLYMNGKNTVVDPNAICRSIERRMDKYAEMVENSELKYDVTALGFDHDQYIEYFRPPTKDSETHMRSKISWDIFFYNSHMLSGIQYERKRLKSTTESKNYSYNKKEEDIKIFHDFVSTILSPNRATYSKWKEQGTVFYEENNNCEESAYDFYIKTMEYYYLETYKRVDFMIMCAELSKDVPIKEIGPEHLAILKRFHPTVFYPVMKRMQCDFNGFVQDKYYRPMLFADKRMIEKIFVQKKYNPQNAYCQLLKCHVIRARTYEFFKFHVQYISSDYEDIRQFINACYDVRSFHKPCSIVEKYKDDKTRKKIIQRFIHLNSYLFPDSDKRKYDKSSQKAASDNKENCQKEDSTPES